MEKNKLIIIIALAVFIIGGGLIIAYNYNNNIFKDIFGYFYQPEPAKGAVILFYGDGCPHCKNVDDFVQQNKVEEKVNFLKLEVFNNQQNAKLLAKKAEICGLDAAQIGVPFLWDGNTCILGDQDIIIFFQNKIKS